MPSISKNRASFIRKYVTQHPNCASRDVISAWKASDKYDAEMKPFHIHQMKHSLKSKAGKAKKKILKPIPVPVSVAADTDTIAVTAKDSNKPRPKFKGPKKKDYSPVKAALIAMESDIESLIQKATELRQSRLLKENLTQCRRLVGAAIIQGDA